MVAIHANTAIALGTAMIQLGTAAGATQILVLEYDQNDRVGWVLTQNGDRTFSIDFRVQHRR